MTANYHHPRLMVGMTEGGGFIFIGLNVIFLGLKVPSVMGFNGLNRGLTFGGFGGLRYGRSLYRLLGNGVVLILDVPATAGLSAIHRPSSTSHPLKSSMISMSLCSSTTTKIEKSVTVLVSWRWF